MKTSFKPSTISKDFPKIMKLIGGEKYVLFTENNIGTVIHNEVNNKNVNDQGVGHYREDWIMSYFEDCRGTWTVEQ